MTQTVDRGTRVADLAAAADRIRHHILDMGEVQGQGYVGQGLGFADEYGVLPNTPPPCCADTDDMFNTRPYPPSIISGRNAFVTR